MNTRHMMSWISCGLLLTASHAWAGCETDNPYYAQYDQGAKAADAEHRLQDQVEFLQGKAQACPGYQAWQELGEAAFALGKEGRTTAANAYAEAYGLAKTPAEQARSAGRYAELLFADEDPQGAKDYAYFAKNLLPNEEWIKQLAARITARLSEARPDDIKRGLEQAVYRPIVLARLDARNPRAPSKAARPEVAPPRRTSDIPIYFEYDSVSVDGTTADNIAKLASTLGDPQFRDKRFVFVGHTDRHGSDAYNKDLSLRRAKELSRAVIAKDASLTGRISVVGRGKDGLQARGTSAEDDRINRRLEVFIDN